MGGRFRSLIGQTIRKHHYDSGAVYCTSFCNQGHNTKNGRPVGHECYILNVALLRMECEEGAQAVLDYLAETGKRFHNGKSVKGRN